MDIIKLDCFCCIFLEQNVDIDFIDWFCFWYNNSSLVLFLCFRREFCIVDVCVVVCVSDISLQRIVFFICKFDVVGF